jgi:hypothetical protein
MSDTITSLAVWNDADLITNGSQRVVVNQTTIEGAGTTIRVAPHATSGTAALQTTALTLTDGGVLQMAGGAATVSGSINGAPTSRTRSAASD